MELNEAFARIVGRHKLVIVLFLVAGLVAGLALHRGDKPRYSAGARLVISGTDPSSAAVATGLADTVRALATGSDTFASALAAAGVKREPASPAATDVSVRSVGASGVISLSVTDANPDIAIRLANALAKAVVADRVDAVAGDAAARLATVNQSIHSLNVQMSHLQTALNLAVKRAASADPATVNAATAARERAVTQLTVLNQQLSGAVSERFELMNQARPTTARVVDTATNAEPVASGWLADLALAVLIGLGVGTVLAAAAESVRPNVVGRAAIARTLGAPVLATPRLLAGQWRPADVPAIASRISLAATTAAVRRIEIVTVGDWQDLPALTAPIARHVNQVVHSARLGDADLMEVPATAGERGGPSLACGVVAVVPAAIKRDRLDPVHDLLAISGWPLLGVIVVRPNRVVDWLRTHHAVSPGVPRPERKQAPRGSGKPASRTVAEAVRK